MEKKRGRKAGVYAGEQSVAKNVSLRKDEWEKLDNEAERLRLTRSELIRRYLKPLLQQEGE